MEELIKVLKSLHEDLKSEKPKGDMLGCGAGYRNGFEDGYKLVVKRVKQHIDELKADAK